MSIWTVQTQTAKPPPMSKNPPSPEFVYRLATRVEWANAKETGQVPLRAIDEKDGYIHLSTRDQLLETARLHFAGEDNLLALEISLHPIAAHVKFELAPKRGEEFPHLFATLKTSWVKQAISLVPTNDGFVLGDAL